MVGSFAKEILVFQRAGNLRSPVRSIFRLKSGSRARMTLQAPMTWDVGVVVSENAHSPEGDPST